MAKYYISCGTLNLIFSTNKTPEKAAGVVLWECNENDELDEFFYIDERGYRNYISATPDTIVIKTTDILAAEGWTISD